MTQHMGVFNSSIVEWECYMPCLGNNSTYVIVVRYSVGLHVIVGWECYMSLLSNNSTSVIIVGCIISLCVVVKYDML